MQKGDVTVVKWKGGGAHVATDALAPEEPLEILVNGESLAVTMRTPGDDFALTAGFLFTESRISSARDIAAMGYYGSPGDPDWQNMVNATIAADALTTNPLPPGRSFISSAACGVCGKADLVAVRCLARPISASGATVSPETVQRLDERMRAGQRVFDRTGGLHAAALFDFSGEMIVLYEDIGRHNAVDKVIGSELLAGRVPLSDRMLMVSGRAGYEIVQKAAMANIPILCSVSAPSSMAVRLAEDLNMALVGFVRGDSMNVYTHPERLSLAHPEIAGSAAA